MLFHQIAHLQFMITLSNNQTDWKHSKMQNFKHRGAVARIKLHRFFLLRYHVMWCTLTATQNTHDKLKKNLLLPKSSSIMHWWTKRKEKEKEVVVSVPIGTRCGFLDVGVCVCVGGGDTSEWRFVIFWGLRWWLHHHHTTVPVIFCYFCSILVFIFICKEWCGSDKVIALPFRVWFKRLVQRWVLDILFWSAVQKEEIDGLMTKNYWQNYDDISNCSSFGL